MTQPAVRENVFKDEPLLELDPKILRAYQAAIDAYNVGNWDATVTACAKAFEGIAKTNLPYNERGGTLGQLLEKLPKHVKLEQPMLDLAAAVKDPKTLGAHFDLERAIDTDIARATLELLEAFVTYTYLFKVKVHSLIRLLEAHESLAPAAPAKAPEILRPTAPPVASEAKATRSDFDTFELRSNPFDKGEDWR